MDRLSELEVFLAVVETGGFTTAGRRTGVSQPAVSKAIGALENRLGAALFNRSTRNVTLTDQGQRYFDRMKPLVEEIEDANREVTGSAVDMSGLIRIAVPPRSVGFISWQSFQICCQNIPISRSIWSCRIVCGTWSRIELTWR